MSYEDRKGLHYFQHVKRLLDNHGLGNSICDVGSGDSPVATWGCFIARYTVDRRNAPQMAGVCNLQEDWWDFNERLDVDSPEYRFDIITCLQVLEHQAGRQRFVQSLLGRSEKVILSVPVDWPEHIERSHPYDPTSLGEWLDICGVSDGSTTCSFLTVTTDMGCEIPLKRAVIELRN